MKLRTGRIQKWIEAHPTVRTRAVHVYWDIYSKHVDLHMNISAINISHLTNNSRLHDAAIGRTLDGKVTLYSSNIVIISTSPRSATISIAVFLAAFAALTSNLHEGSRTGMLSLWPIVQAICNRLFFSVLISGHLPLGQVDIWLSPYSYSQRPQINSYCSLSLFGWWGLDLWTTESELL